MARNQVKADDGTVFDSQGEVEFYYWLQEAKREGMLLDFVIKPEPFLLSDSVAKVTEQIGARGEPIKPKTKTLLRPHTFRADFSLQPTDDGEEWLAHAWKFEHKLDDGKMVKGQFDSLIFVDVKGGNFRDFQVGSLQNTLFNVNRKWVAKEYGVLIERVVPAELFGATWVPEKARLTPKRKQPKKAYIGMGSVEAFIEKATAEAPF